jgi:hypothetical protein
MSIETQDQIIKYLEKSYTIIQRLTDTNKIITLKNKELFTKNIIYQTKIKLLEEENKKLKENYIERKYLEIELQNQDEFEIL